MARNLARGPGTGSWVLLALVLIVADQVTKYMVVGSFDLGERLAVWPGWFDLTLVYNRGAAFSFLAAASGWQRWVFTGIGVVASAVIVFLLRRHAGERLFSLGLACILGGAVGNVIDRVLRGQVVDFLLAHWNDRWYFPAFNVADVAITVGAGCLILDELLRVSRTRKAARR